MSGRTPAVVAQELVRTWVWPDLGDKERIECGAIYRVERVDRPRAGPTYAMTARIVYSTRSVYSKIKDTVQYYYSEGSLVVHPVLEFYFWHFGHIIGPTL
jgi:hypothetical protein